MHVRVDQARNNRAAAGIDDLSPRPDESVDGGVVADCCDAALAHCECVLDAEIGVERRDLGIDYDKVCLLRICRYRYGCT